MGGLVSEVSERMQGAPSVHERQAARLMYTPADHKSSAGNVPAPFFISLGTARECLVALPWGGFLPWSGGLSPALCFVLLVCRIAFVFFVLLEQIRFPLSTASTIISCTRISAAGPKPVTSTR